MASGATTGAHARTVRRRWSVLFGVAGIALVPWTVVLGLVQPRSAAVGDVPLAALGVVVAIVVGLLVCAVLALVGSAHLVPTASATGALALCAGFFHVVTGTAHDPRAATVTTVLVLGPTAVLCGVLARPGRPGARRRSPVLAAVLVAAAVLGALAWAGSASATFDPAYAHHLKITWTVLDIAEATTLLATAAALRWRPVDVPAVASAAGALLCCDVWFNVVGAVGEARTEAVQMAFVSLPLAAAAFVVAVRAVRQAE